MLLPETGCFVPHVLLRGYQQGDPRLSPLRSLRPFAFFRGSLLAVAAAARCISWYRFYETNPNRKINARICNDLRNKRLEKLRNEPK